MFYYQYNPEDGKIISSAEWLPDWFEYYVESEIDYNVYNLQNCYVEDNEIKVTLAGHIYKKNEDYNKYLMAHSYCEITANKFINPVDDYSRYYHVFEKDEAILKIHCLDENKREATIEFSDKAAALAMVDDIVKYCHEFTINKNDTFYSIAHAQTVEEIEAITFNTPVFRG